MGRNTLCISPDTSLDPEYAYLLVRHKRSGFHHDVHLLRHQGVYAPEFYGGVGAVHHGEGRQSFIGASEYHKILFGIPIITAYVLYKKVFLNNFIRIVLYLPGAISGIMMARLFNQFVQSQGILGGILEAFGLPMNSASLFTDESTALGTIMFFDVWMGLGGSLILWLGAVNRIPTELVEYNKLLGLGELKEFVLVVLPLIWPTFVTMVTLSLIGFFGATGSVLVFTQGNAGTTTISYWMYRILLNQEESMFHISNAAGLIMMLITVPVVFVGRFIMNKWGQEIEY